MIDFQKFPNLGVKHVLPILLTSSEVVSNQFVSCFTKAPNAALNGHDGEDIPGYRSLTRHHISTPERLENLLEKAGDFQSWNIMNLFGGVTWNILPPWISSDLIQTVIETHENLGGSGGMAWLLYPTFMSVMTSSCCIVPSWHRDTGGDKWVTSRSWTNVVFGHTGQIHPTITTRTPGHQDHFEDRGSRTASTWGTSTKGRKVKHDETIHRQNGALNTNNLNNLTTKTQDSNGLCSFRICSVVYSVSRAKVLVACTIEILVTFISKDSKDMALPQDRTAFSMTCREVGLDIAHFGASLTT